MRNGAKAMKQVLVALMALGVMVGGAQASAPTEAQKAEFYKTCMGIAQDNALCNCKAEAAMTLLDENFMAEVIASMKGKAPPTADNVKYGQYIGKSNAKCIPGY